MAVDVLDLRSFYASPLGQTAHRLLSAAVSARWGDCARQRVLGVGYATPYLDAVRANCERAIAFMPAEQGVVNWPASGPSASALVDITALPLPDSVIDRVLVIHALEAADQPYEFLAEVWRILAPGGRMIVIAPSRAGVWARVDSTPFGHGQPYSRSQLRNLLRETMFSPLHWCEALYTPPFERPFLLRCAPVFEKVGARLALPGAGVHLVEATKQLYNPALGRRAGRRRSVAFQPALAAGARLGDVLETSATDELFRERQAKA
jgi:SAM-dependent methyltransferase